MGVLELGAEPRDDGLQPSWRETEARRGPEEEAGMSFAVGRCSRLSHHGEPRDDEGLIELGMSFAVGGEVDCK